MWPIALQILQIVFPIIVKEGPAAVAAIKALFDKKEPTAADWEALRARSYESFNIPQGENRKQKAES